MISLVAFSVRFEPPECHKGALKYTLMYLEPRVYLEPPDVMVNRGIEGMFKVVTGSSRAVIFLGHHRSTEKFAEFDEKVHLEVTLDQRHAPSLTDTSPSLLLRI